MSSDTGYKEFVNAATRGDIFTIKKMIDQKFNPATAYESVEQALTVEKDVNGKIIACCVRVADDAFMQAIRANHPEMVNLLKFYVFVTKLPDKRIRFPKEISVPRNDIALFYAAFRVNAYQVIAQSVPADTRIALLVDGKTPIRCAVECCNASMAKVLSTRNDSGFIGSVQDAKDLLFVLNHCFSEDPKRISFLADMGREKLELILKNDKELRLSVFWRYFLKGYLKIKGDEGDKLRTAKVETLFSVPGSKKVFAARVLLGDREGRIDSHVITHGLLGLIYRLKVQAEKMSVVSSVGGGGPK